MSEDTPTEPVAPVAPVEGAPAEGAAGDAAAPPPDGSAEAVEADLAEAMAAVEGAGSGEPDPLTVAQAERDDYLDALRRLQADFDNYRKRMIKQQTEVLEQAARGLVEKLLHVLDAADLALAHGGGEEVAQVAGLLMDTLVKEGLEGVAPKEGEPFDPTVHEAVVHEQGDTEHQEIADTLRAGYLWKGALLRPAMVKVRG